MFVVNIVLNNFEKYDVFSAVSLFFTELLIAKKLI